jgi:hypothetical protein
VDRLGLEGHHLAGSHHDIAQLADLGVAGP